MPSSSKKQHNFMAAIANNPAFAKKVGIPQSVGKDYTTADKGKTFKRGGDMAAKKMNMGGMMKKGYASGGAMPMVMKDGKKVPSFAADGEGKMAKGGMHKMPDGKMMKDSAMKKKAPPMAPPMAGAGMSLGMKKGGMKKMAKGGGIESRGKTRGKFI